MYRKKIRLGIAPTKRGFLSMEEANRQKNRLMNVIRTIQPKLVELVDLEDVCENGIAYTAEHAEAAIQKLKKAGIDALFLQFCDFGTEQTAAAIASALQVPTLVWGARDERANQEDSRGRDTQCGMFAATKVLRRHGVTFSYIYNCETEGEEFRSGYENFLRVAAILKDLKGLRIAKIGERPTSFMSVMTNEADLIKRLGITTVPISPFQIAEAAKKLIAENEAEYSRYYDDLAGRFDCSQVPEEDVRKVAAAKVALERLMKEQDCSVGAFECWSAFPSVLGVCPCTMLGELADAGLPLSCETDVNGAITLAILRACSLYEESGFLADLTIRHPQNDNAELLWHCGPFPYSLKKTESQARMVGGQERFLLKEGDLTVCRFDDLDGTYYLFAGEGKTTEGPETTGTYVWLEVDNWKRWEEKLMFGPYIHHVGCAYGKYLPVLREVARYLGIVFDNAHEQGTYSL